MRKLLIVTSDDILPYQPTILNLYDLLIKDFSVQIISFDPVYLGKGRDLSRNVYYITPNQNLRFFLRMVELIINAPLKRIDSYLFSVPFRLQLIRKYKEKLLNSHLGKFKADEVIAADEMPLSVCQKKFGPVHFLSLEIIPRDSYRKKIQINKIKSLIIQNEMRYSHLFGNQPLPVFYIQNAPFLKMMQIYSGERKGLIWAGTVVKNFGVLHCIDFLRHYPEYCLTLKGGIERLTGKEIFDKYDDLLKEGKLVVNKKYMETAEFISFLSSFRIGFCFYEWDLIRKNFNYQSVPSGKLFMYLAAGVPVIASDIPAFQFIREMGAGELVADYKPETLYLAIQRIESNYDLYSSNAYEAFRENCFDKGAIPFRDFLLSGG